MILVTVGTTHFDDLIREVDQLARSAIIKERVYAQIGSGRHIPQYIEWSRFLPDMRAFEEQADLVICHGGSGSVFELLELGKPFIAVPNRSLQDDHQSDLLRAVEAEGWCTCCWNLADLRTLLSQKPSHIAYPKEPQLPGKLWADLLSRVDTSRRRGRPVKY